MILMSEEAVAKKLQADASSIYCLVTRSVDKDNLICYCSCIATATDGLN